MHVDSIDTPAILIDLDIMERNLTRVAAYASGKGLQVRPHTKTHKIPALGRRQLALGANGLTVAKVGEAEVMLLSGTPALLVAYPVIGPSKLKRLMQVAAHTDVTVALDSAESANALSEAAVSAGRRIAVLAEIDVGLRRVGVQPGAALRALLSVIARLRGLEFRGLTFYPGHLKNASDPVEAVSGCVARALEGVKAAGLESTVVSGGSTPLLWRSHEVAGVNEIRPGTYIFNDRNTVASGAAQWEDCAASILATIVSTAVEGQIIIDGGSKTFSSDRMSDGSAGFGRVAGAEGAVFDRMNEEHGYISLDGVRRDFRVGDRVSVIPNHICVAMNLHEKVYGIRNGIVEEIWQVEGRGKLQ